MLFLYFLECHNNSRSDLIYLFLKKKKQVKELKCDYYFFKCMFGTVLVPPLAYFNAKLKLELFWNSMMIMDCVEGVFLYSIWCRASALQFTKNRPG